MSRKQDLRAQAVLNAVYPRALAEGLVEHGRRRWVRVPWSVMLWPDVRFELHLASSTLLRCERHVPHGWVVTRFAAGDWDAELLAGLGT